jgi:hypothetical protein
MSRWKNKRLATIETEIEMAELYQHEKRSRQSQESGEKLTGLSLQSSQEIGCLELSPPTEVNIKFLTLRVLYVF